MHKRPPQKTNIDTQNEKKSGFWLPVVLVAAVLVYLPSLTGGFALDDRYLILQDPLAHSLRYFYLTFFCDFLRGFLGPDTAYYRPLVTMTYQANYTLSGASPFAFRFTNILLNAGVATLIYMLVRKLTKNSLAAGIAGLAFAVLPSHAESVAWISGRTDVISTLFMLGALLAFIAHFERRPKFSWPLGLLCSVLFLFALFSKENAVVFPVLIGAYMWLFGRSIKRDEIIKWAILLIPPMLIYIIPRQLVVGSAFTSQLDLMLKERLMGIGIAYAAYLRMLFVPMEVQVVYDVFPIGMKYPELAIIAWLIPAAMIAMIVKLRKKSPVVSFGLIWIFISLLPVTNLLPTIGPLPAERFVYLASVGSALLIGLLVRMAYQHQPSSFRLWKPLVTIIFCWFILYSGLLNVQGSQFYLSNVAWAQAISKSETRFTMFRAAAAQYYADTGMLKEAEQEYEETLALDDNNPSDWISLARVKRGLGKSDETFGLLTEAASRFPENPRVQFQLGIAYAECEEMENAAGSFARTVELNPKHAQAWRNLGKAYLEMGKYRQSVQAYEHAFKLINPNQKDREDLEKARKGSDQSPVGP